MKIVLLVDDEQAVTLSLSMALEAAGYKVVCASNGEDAVLALHDSKPDVILLDIMMPGMDGLETLQTFKSHPDFREVPVIMMSGARPLVDHCNYQWVDFLYKPFTAKELIAAIQKYAPSSE